MRSEASCSLISQPVEQHVGVRSHDFIFANFTHSTVIELIPFFVEEILTVGRVVPAVEAAVVIHHSVKVVYDRLSLFVGCVDIYLHNR